MSGDVIGPFSFTMTTCDTTGMYKAIEPQITGTYNHLIYYFNQTSLCTFGGLGEEGSVTKPSKRTWMNGSLGCVVLMQEPGHNLGLMHANTMKCGTYSFSTTPATSCTITEYGSSMTTMGGGCRQLNAYERWYMQWLTGCNGVRVPASGTFNLLPLENTCPGGSGVQVLQVPFPATLTVERSAGHHARHVSLKNYYVELRTAGGIFDTYGTTGRGGGSVTFTAPTVFIYASDDVKTPTTSTGATAPHRDPAEQRLDRAAQHDAVGHLVHRPDDRRAELHRSGGRRHHHAHVDQRDGRHHHGDQPERHRLADLHRRHDLDGARARQLHRGHRRRRRAPHHRRGWNHGNHRRRRHHRRGGQDRDDRRRRHQRRGRHDHDDDRGDQRLGGRGGRHDRDGNGAGRPGGRHRGRTERRRGRARGDRPGLGGCACSVEAPTLGNSGLTWMGLPFLAGLIGLSRRRRKRTL